MDSIGSDQPVHHPSPMVGLGDFNEVLAPEDKSHKTNGVYKYGG